MADAGRIKIDQAEKICLQESQGIKFWKSLDALPKFE